MRQPHRAGEKRFVDDAGHTAPVVDRQSGASVFVAVLGASSYIPAYAAPLDADAARPVRLHPLELEPVGVVDEPVEDGVGEGGGAGQLMPLGQGELAGDEGGARGLSVLEEVASVVGVELGEPEAVEDEEAGVGEGCEVLGVAAVAAGDGEVVQEPGDAQVQLVD